jgi:uncharacterized membrane protein YukC
MYRYDRFFIILYIIWTLAFIIIWMMWISQFLSDNEENIERWANATMNFLWEKYSNFVNEYAPENVE